MFPVLAAAGNESEPTGREIFGNFGGAAPVPAGNPGLGLGGDPAQPIDVPAAAPAQPMAGPGMHGVVADGSEAATVVPLFDEPEFVPGIE